ncbi:hypothetical protein EBU95_12250 [bacterium]|nr:hypothetical protein [bacterium]
MNLKYLFYGAIVATTLQVKNAEGGLSKRISHNLRVRDHLDTAIEDGYRNLVSEANRHRELLNDLKERPEDEDTQQRIREVEKKLSDLNKNLKRLKQELEQIFSLRV